LSKISMFNGQDSLKKWSEPQCNQVPVLWNGLFRH
jgi:hypothetical protein